MMVSSASQQLPHCLFAPLQEPLIITDKEADEIHNKQLTLDQSPTAASRMSALSALTACPPLPSEPLGAARCTHMSSFLIVSCRSTLVIARATLLLTLVICQTNG